MRALPSLTRHSLTKFLWKTKTQISEKRYFYKTRLDGFTNWLHNLTMDEGHLDDDDTVLLIMKANKMHCFSNLFDKVRYMFWTCPLSNIRSTSTLYTHNRYFVILILLTVCQQGHASRRQQNYNDIYLLRVYSVEMFLMMDSGHV